MLFGILGALIFQLVWFSGNNPQLSNTNSSNSVQQQQNISANVISARQFNLFDSNGRLRAQLAFAKQGPPGFWIMDERGTARIAMGLYEDGTSHIGLQDKDGNMIELLRSIGSDEAPLLIFKNRGADRMILGLNSSLNPFHITYENGEKKKYLGTNDGP